jgi:hypothetical protein
MTNPPPSPTSPPSPPPAAPTTIASRACIASSPPPGYCTAGRNASIDRVWARVYEGPMRRPLSLVVLAAVLAGCAPAV